jgi:hypothetical protein
VEVKKIAKGSDCSKNSLRLQHTIGKISPMDSIVLHHTWIKEILKWNQEHLDAYLQLADIIIEQRDKPD